MPSNEQIAGLKFILSANDQKFAQQMKGVRKDINGVKDGFMEVAGALGLAFGVQQIGSMVSSLSKLSGQAEGVRNAFSRLPDSVNLMNRLKRATHETVSELDLMKRSVMAANFKINLEALPRLLEFAALRAQQTGQSVDYLVDSIVTGIGRKSALILDNLGISAAELKEQLKETPDYAQAVAAIIEREMPKMGAYIETAATEQERLNAAWENFKISIGDLVNSAGVPGLFKKITTDVKMLTQLFGGPEMPSTMDDLKFAIEQINYAIKSVDKPMFDEWFEVAQKRAAELGVELIKVNKEWHIMSQVPGVSSNVPSLGQLGEALFGKKPKAIKETISSLKDKIKELNDELLLQSSNSGYVKIKKQIEELELALLSITDGEEDHNKSAIIESILPDLPEVAIGAIGGIGGSKGSMEKASGFLKTKIELMELDRQLDMTAEKAAEYSDMALMFGETLGDAFGDLASGTATAAQAIARAAAAMIRSIGQVITAKLVLKAIEDPSTGPSVFAKLALVAFAFSAAASIVSRLGAQSAGSGGGGFNQGGYNQRSIDRGIYVSGEFRMQGSTAVALVNKGEYQKSRLG